MAKKPVHLMEMEPPRCIQDPGFLNTQHAVWAAKKFLDLAGRKDLAAESARRYAELTRKKKKTGFLSRHGFPIPKYLN